MSSALVVVGGVDGRRRPGTCSAPADRHVARRGDRSTEPRPDRGHAAGGPRPAEERKDDGGHAQRDRVGGDQRAERVRLEASRPTRPWRRDAPGGRAEGGRSAAGLERARIGRASSAGASAWPALPGVAERRDRSEAARPLAVAALGLAPLRHARVAAVAHEVAPVAQAAVAPRLLERGRLRPAAEDHLARRRLQHAGDADLDRPAQRLLGLVHHHHGAVVEVADALARLLAFLDDEDLHQLAGQDHRLERVRELVDVEDGHAAQLRDLVEVEVVGDDLAAHACAPAR